MIRILIADDHPIFRQGLKQTILDQPNMIVSCEAQNSQEVLEFVRKYDFDIVVMDMTMPGRGGIDLVKELKREHPGLPVLVLSMHPENQYAVRALKAGAAGYMCKESAAYELADAIRKIIKGARYITPAVAELLTLYVETETEKPLHETLSDREYQVMLMIASGKQVGKIADELSLSVKTVDTYRARVLNKMGMKSNAELIHYAIKNNLII